MGWAATPINKYFFKPLQTVDKAVNQVAVAATGAPVVGAQLAHAETQAAAANNAAAVGAPFVPTAYTGPPASTPQEKYFEAAQQHASGGNTAANLLAQNAQMGTVGVTPENYAATQAATQTPAVQNITLPAPPPIVIPASPIQYAAPQMPMQEAVKSHITLVGEDSELAQSQKRARGGGATGIGIPPVGGAPGPGQSSGSGLA